MAKTTDFILPKMGESITEGTILNWLVQEGESFEEGDILVEVGTDKVDNEVPAPFDGVMVKHLANAGDVVEIGAPVANIEAQDGSSKSEVTPKSDSQELKIPSGLEDVQKGNKSSEASQNKTGSSDSRERVASAVQKQVSSSYINKDLF